MISSDNLRRRTMPTLRPPNVSEAKDEPFSPTENAISAAAEISVTQTPSVSIDDFDAVLDACENVSRNECAFRRAESHIIAAVTEAKRTYDSALGDETKQRKLIDRLVARHNRERRPSLKKLACNCVCLAVNPTTAEDFSCCSEWSNILKWAALENVSDEAFATWVIGKSIRKAKEIVRAAGKQAEPKHKTSLAAVCKELALLQERIARLEGNDEASLASTES